MPLNAFLRDSLAENFEVVPVEELVHVPKLPRPWDRFPPRHPAGLCTVVSTDHGRRLVHATSPRSQVLGRVTADR
jgi:hypothetical protein